MRRTDRSQVKDLGEAVRAFCARPGDADAARAVLAFPLKREAWEGLGPDVDDALAALTPFVGQAVHSLAGSAHARAWVEAALEPCERALAATEEGTPAYLEVKDRVVQILIAMGGYRVAQASMGGSPSVRRRCTSSAQGR